LSKYLTLLGLATAVLLAMSAPALAASTPELPGSSLGLTVSGPDSSDNYTFTVTNVVVSGSVIDFIDQTDGNAQIGSCPVTDSTVTCTFVPSFPANVSDPIQVVANEISLSGELMRQSGSVTVTTDCPPKNNLPEVPYVALLPVAALGAGAVLRRRALKAR
jgi:hypothetical protein